MALLHRRDRRVADEGRRWQEERDEVCEFLTMAKEWSGETSAGGQASPIQLKKGERVFRILNGASLIEPRRLPGRWEGRSQGVSFRIAKGVRYRVGTSKGHFVQGAERPQAIDTGTAAITNQRVVFLGPKQSREWAYAKLLGYQHDPDLPWTALQVSNRQKVSGILYDEVYARLVRFDLALALAHYNGTVDQFVAGLDAELAEHDKERPAAISEPQTEGPASWCPDPTGRHELWRRLDRVGVNTRHEGAGPHHLSDAVDSLARSSVALLRPTIRRMRTYDYRFVCDQVSHLSKNRITRTGAITVNIPQARLRELAGLVFDATPPPVTDGSAR